MFLPLHYFFCRCISCCKGPRATIFHGCNGFSFFYSCIIPFFCVCVSKLLPSRFGEFCIVEISPFREFLFSVSVAIIKEKKWNYGPIFLNIEKIYHIK